MKNVMMIALVCCFLWACDQPMHTGRVDVPLRFSVAQMPLNLDPRYATDAASARLNRLIYQALVDFDAASRPVPKLAHWTSPNPLEYRFTLNAAPPPFHHQLPLTAEDVKATYDSLIGLKDSPHAAEFGHVASIELVDSHTLVFHLKQRDVHFPEKLIIGILPKDLILKRHDFSRAPVGNGPLQFVSWHNTLTFKRRQDDQVITLTEVRDPTVRVLKLLRGEVDLLQGDLPPELVAYLEKQPEITVKSSVGANFSYLGLNLQDAMLCNIKVRQALAHAIDRNAIIAQVMVKETRAASVILPPEHYAGNPALEAYVYDPQRARRLLQEAGISLPLKLVYKTSTDAQRVRLATILQAQMKPVGINLEIRSLDWGTFFDDVKHGQFQLFGLTWVGISTPEIYSKAFGSNQFPPHGFNRGHFVDPVLDSLLEKEEWTAATARINRQLPYIPLWYEGQFVAYAQGITGYAPKADGNWDDLAVITKSATISNYAH